MKTMTSNRQNYDAHETKKRSDGSNDILVYIVFGDYVIMCFFLCRCVGQYAECHVYLRGYDEDGWLWVNIFDGMYESLCDSMAWQMRVLGTRVIVRFQKKEWDAYANSA